MSDTDQGLHEYEISVTETHQRHTDRDENFLLIDIREAEELAVAKIDGALHIPMGDLPGALAELDADEDTTVALLCRTGRRSLSAALYMIENGFGGARSVAGGIHLWSDLIDPTLTKY